MDAIVKRFLLPTSIFEEQPGNRSPELRIREYLRLQLNAPLSIPISLMRRLPLNDVTRGHNAVTSYDGHIWRLADLQSVQSSHVDIMGLAVDLGSTSVVFTLVNLETGETFQPMSLPNPQRKYGEDILSRILFAVQNGVEHLQHPILQLFNEAIDSLCEKHGISSSDIFYLSVAGNTTMCHFLLGLDSSFIFREPYRPQANTFDVIPAQELGLKCNENALVYVFPNIGSYFGGDLLAGILATGMHKQEAISLLVDVGTNAEVVLGNKDWLVACAGAAGPALEGGILSCGTVARPGAIERVTIHQTAEAIPVLSYKTIDNKPVCGICGSGVIDLFSAMFLTGIVDPTGKLVLERMGDRAILIQDEWAYVLAFASETSHGRPIYLSQSDIKNLMRSKAAMYTLLEVVTQSVGLNFQDIENIFVAGAFGNYINPRSAIEIGMLPDVPIQRFKPVGNSASTGAVQLLLERTSMQEVKDITERLTYLEMNARGDFMKLLTAAMFLPHTDAARFPTVKGSGHNTHLLLEENPEIVNM